MTTQTQETPVMDAIITEHNTAENSMIQHFGDNTVCLITDNETKCMGIFVNYELKDTRKNVSFEELKALQQAAFLIWLQLHN